MPECFRKYKNTNHQHIGPTFSRCVKCKQIICDDCVAKHLSANQVVCVECAQTFITRQGPRIRSHPWQERRERSIAVAQGLGSGIKLFLGGLASSTYKFFRYTTKPFRSDGYQYQVKEGYEVVFTDDNMIWIETGPSRSDQSLKVRFDFIFIGVALAIMILGLVYAVVCEIPFSRILVAFSGAIIFWGILAIYLQYLFASVLSRLIFQFITYGAAFFLAILFGIWLINQEFIDKILAGLGFY